MQLRRLDDATAEDVDHGEGDDDAHQGDQTRHPAPAPRSGPPLDLLHHPERLVLGPGPRLIAGKPHLYILIKYIFSLDSAISLLLTPKRFS